MKKRLLAALTIVLFFSTAFAAKEPRGVITLAFTPKNPNAPLLSAEAKARPVALRVEDARSGAEPDVVGTGTDDEDKPFPYRATNPVAKFAEEALAKCAAEWGVKVDANADVVIVVRLQRFFVTEKDQAMGSTYNADARVAGSFESKAGAAIATGAASGSASRYGKKRSSENSNELLSDALKEAYARLLDEPAIQAAWSGKAKAPVAAAASGGAMTPSALLTEVQGLVKQGFSDDLLVKYLSVKTVSPFGAEDLKAWKDAGVSEKVISAAMDRAPK